MPSKATALGLERDVPEVDDVTELGGYSDRAELTQSPSIRHHNDRCIEENSQWHLTIRSTSAGRCGANQEPSAAGSSLIWLMLRCSLKASHRPLTRHSYDCWTEFTALSSSPPTSLLRSGVTVYQAACAFTTHLLLAHASLENEVIVNPVGFTTPTLDTPDKRLERTARRSTMLA